MPDNSLIAVAVAVLALAGTYAASVIRDRNNPMSQVVDGALATTSIVQALIKPMQAEIAELRTEVTALKVSNITMRNENTVLRERVAVLEDQLRSLGHEPLPPKGDK